MGEPSSELTDRLPADLRDVAERYLDRRGQQAARQEQTFFLKQQIPEHGETIDSGTSTGFAIVAQ